MHIQSTKDSQDHKLKMVVYGFSGVGKTTLVKTLKEKALVISAEAGLLSLAGTNIDYVDISTDDNGAQIPKVDRVRRLGEIYKTLITEKQYRENYQWLYIDSITEISDCLMERLNADFPDSKDNIKKYGEYAKKMKSLITMFRDIPYYNVCFTAQAGVDKDENNKRYIGIELVGKIAQRIPYYFDEVFYLGVSDDEEHTRHLYTDAAESRVCKDRSGKLADVEPACLQTVVNKIRGANR